MKYIPFILCWLLFNQTQAQNYHHKWENAQTLRLTPFQTPLIEIKISQNSSVEVALEEFKWIDNKSAFLPCESEYSQQIRFRIKQGDKEMKIYGFAPLLRKMQLLNNNGKKYGEKIPIIDFQNGEFIVNEETIGFLRVENYSGQNFQRESNHFLQPNQQMGRDFIAMLHLQTTQANLFQSQAAKCYFRNYPLDTNSPLLVRQGENTSYGFFLAHNFNYSFGQVADKENFWRDLLTKKQSFDIEKEAKLAHYDFVKMGANLLTYLIPLDAVAVDNEELIGRIWDYNGNFFLIQSNPDWRKWEVIYTQKLSQDAASRMRVLGKNEILVSLTDKFLYGKLNGKKWNFEFINLNLVKKEGETFQIVDFEWADKNDIRAVIQWTRNGSKTPEVDIIQCKNQSNKVLFAGLSEFKSVCYAPKENKWVYACSRFIIQQKLGKTNYYPIANQPVVQCLENDFAEIFYDLSRIQSYDSLKKVFPASQIQYILTQTYPSTNNNLLAAAYLDTAGNLYGLMGEKQDKIMRLECRDDEYRAKDEFIFIQVLSNNAKRVAGAKVKIAGMIWQDTLIWDKNTQKMEPAYCLNIRKNTQIGQKTNGNGNFFKSYWPTDMEISHPDYQTATHLNSDVSTLNWFALLTSPDANFSECQLYPSHLGVKTLFLYKKGQLVTYFMGKKQPVNHFINDEIILVVNQQQRPLRPALFAKIKELNLSIDSSDFARAERPRNWPEMGRYCDDYQYLIKLKKLDNSDFDSLEAAELATLRDSSLGVNVVGMRASLAAQNGEIGSWERAEPNTNQIFITDYQPNGDPKKWEQRVAAAQQLGFKTHTQQSAQVLILTGGDSWTYRKLVAKSEELVQNELFKNCILDVAMALPRSNCWD